MFSDPNDRWSIICRLIQDKSLTQMAPIGPTTGPSSLHDVPIFTFFQALHKILHLECIFKCKVLVHVDNLQASSEPFLSPLNYMSKRVWRAMRAQKSIAIRLLLEDRLIWHIIHRKPKAKRGWAVAQPRTLGIHIFCRASRTQSRYGLSDPLVCVYITCNPSPLVKTMA